MASMVVKRKTVRRCPPRVLPPTAGVSDKLSTREHDIIEKMLEEPVEYVADPALKRRNAEATFFPPQARRASRPISDILENPNGVQAAMSTMTAQEERLAFQRFNYARYRVYQVLRRYHGKRLTLAGVRQLLPWQRRALVARSTIVQANLPLVLAMAKRTRLSGVDFNELISEGNVALLRSVGKFDCSRGFKFSTYACRAILKSFSRVAMRTARHRCRFPTEFDPMLEKSDFLDTKREAERGDRMDELRSVLRRNLAELNDIEWTVISSRFALDAHGDEQPVPKTLEQVGEIIGVTKERVRQIQNKALRKLRVALEESIVAA